MKSNYYTIHKNKKPKKRLYVSKIDRKSVRIIMQVISNAIELSQNLIRLSQGMGELSKAAKSVSAHISGGTPTSIVPDRTMGTGLNLERKKELIETLNGLRSAHIIRDIDEASLKSYLDKKTERISRVLKRIEERDLMQITALDQANKDKLAFEKAEIKQKIAQFWEETERGFKADNLLIYYRPEFEEWRLKDTSDLSTKDICSIDFPLEDRNLSFIKRQCSIHHKCPD